MTAPEQLSADESRAVDLLARGWDREKVAGEIGVTSKTISRWKAKPAFAAAVKERRDAILDEEIPTAKSILESALSATLTNGRPAWGIRMKACELLLKSSGGVPPEDQVRETVIFMPDGEEVDGDGS